jgi:hypothetical protein
MVNKQKMGSWQAIWYMVYEKAPERWDMKLHLGCTRRALFSEIGPTVLHQTRTYIGLFMSHFLVSTRQCCHFFEQRWERLWMTAIASKHHNIHQIVHAKVGSRHEPRRIWHVLWNSRKFPYRDILSDSVRRPAWIICTSDTDLCYGSNQYIPSLTDG